MTRFESFNNYVQQSSLSVGAELRLGEVVVKF